MHVYHCMIELKDPDRSLAFAAVAEKWFSHLVDQELILNWRLLRRKFGLASDDHTDLIVEIEVKNMSAMEDAFTKLGQLDDDASRLYTQMHDMIGAKKIGLYRPYPDPEQRERISLI